MEKDGCHGADDCHGVDQDNWTEKGHQIREINRVTCEEVDSE